MAENVSSSRPMKSQNSDLEDDGCCPGFPAIQFRQTLNKSVINMFNKGCTDQSTPVLSSFTKFINCFRHCLEEFPEIFVSSKSAEGNVTSQSVDTAQVFTEWLLMRLLGVLSQPYTSDIHEGCINLLASLLQVVRSLDLLDFQRYCHCLLNLMKELISFAEASFNLSSNTFVIEHYFTKKNKQLNIEEIEGLDLRNIPIVINNLPECEQLQLRLTQLLQKISSSLLLFLPDQYCHLWNMLLGQIEAGNLHLKEVSLEAIVHFIRTESFPPSSRCITYALDCLQALLLYCCSTDYDGDRLSFENSVGRFFVNLTEAIKAKSVYPSVNEFYLGSIFNQIIEIVAKQGFINLKSVDLLSAIGIGILNFVHVLQEHCVSKANMDLLHEKLHLRFGEIKALQFVVPYFLYIIKIEVQKDKGKGGTELCSATQGGFSSTSRKKNSIQSGLSPYLKVKQSSPMWCSLFDWMIALMRSNSPDKQPVEKCVSTLNTLNKTLEILLTSSLLVDVDQSHENLFPIESLKLSSSQSQVFPLETTNNLMCYMQNILSAAFSFDVNIVSEIVDFVCCIVCFQDSLFLTMDDLKWIVGVLSVPWISDQVATSQCPSVWPQSYTFPLELPVELTIKCLHYLSILPTEVCSQWRDAVLRLCFESPDEKLRCAAYQTLPNFCLLSVVTESNLLKIGFSDLSVAVSREIAKILGKISCAFDSSCILCRKRLPDGSMTTFPSLVCNVCDRGAFLVNQQNFVSPLCSDMLSGALVHSIQHHDALVRQESVLSLSSYFVHNPIQESLLNIVMTLITDPDYTVCKIFSEVIQNMLKHITRDSSACRWTPEMDEILINNLRTALNTLKLKRNHRMLQVLLSTICEIAKAADNDLLLICIISLLEHLLSSIPSVAAFARFKIKEIAVAKQYSMPNLFKAYKEPICKFLAESMFTCGKDVNKVINMLKEIHSIFGYLESKSFLCVTQQYILPYLVKRDASITTPLLKILADLMGTIKRDLLLNNFPFIFSHLVRYCKKVELEKALLYVQKETDLEFGSLLRCNYQLTHNELLLHISTHYDNVFAGLATLALKSDSQRGSEISREDMADYLQPKLLGFLVYFDSQLLKSSITLDDKKLALKSLICIMELMGQRYITSVRFKIMATLRIALRFKDGEFPQICCRAWNTFVHSIDIASLGPLLNQVAVALLPLMELEPKAVSEILAFLIIENRWNFKEFFHELYFIPDVLELQSVNAVLKEYTENPSSQSDFQTILSHSLKLVSHENLDVRLHALQKLKQVLNMNQLSLHDHLLGRESVDHLLSHLINVVINSCRESDAKARNILGECLGAIGAIDPGRLEMKDSNSTGTSVSFFHSIEDDNFVVALIRELTHSFLAAGDCRVQDCSAFAIQEVLQIYMYSDGKQSSGKENIWQSFSLDIQEILDVLSNSQYRPLERSKKSYPKPIYQSAVGSTFNDWVTSWFSSLLLKVKNETAAKVFHSCSMIVKHDLNCVLFLLPHVIVYSLIDSEDAESDIMMEILEVLNHCEQMSYPSDLCRLSCQTVFSIIDHLSKWVRYKRSVKVETTAKQASGPKLSQDTEFQAVNLFLNKMPQLLLAKSSFKCQAYTRALMHLEQHLKDQPLEQEINFLQRLYAALDDSDSVTGLASVRKGEVSLKDAILEHEATGDMQAAFSCYEKAIDIFPDEVSYYGGLLKCFLEMDQPSTAITYANGIISEWPKWEENLNCYRVEAAWKLANWEALDSFLSHEVSQDKWNVGVGKLLLHINHKDFSGFEEQIQVVCHGQMAPLSAASMENGAYLRGYEHLTRLHMLTDLQKSSKVIFSEEESNLDDRSAAIDNVLTEWKQRLHIVQSSLRFQEPILDFHRVLLKMGKVQHPELAQKFDLEIASYWLKSAKLARKNGHHQRAYSCLLEAGRINTPDFFMEKTKWHWNKGEKEQAICCLKKSIEEHFPDSKKFRLRVDNSKEQLMCAQAKLLLAVYSEESAITDSNRLIQMYQDVLVVQPSWEESHFHLAKYFDKMLNALEKQDTKPEIMVHIAKSFGTSLLYGCKHVYHSLPRLLDIWFDIGTQVVEHQGNARKTSTVRNFEQALSQMTNSVIPELFDKLPLYLFMTAFPQLVSRICHSHNDVFAQLKKIIAKLLVVYSQQAMWMMIAVSKSSYPMRVQRCRMIFQEAIILRPTLTKFIADTTRLADKLIELSNKTVNENVLKISESFNVLHKLVEDRNFSPIMMPLQSQMNVTIPNVTYSSDSHNAFPFRPICIQGFQDTVEIFPSLQRPKKLVIRGTDGKMYGIICKPKDDLRKDCRLMEFNNLVNRYLKSDPEARKRQLYIRTYAVIPLNEECGLIEWVPNLSGLRIVTSKIYKSKGLHVSGREIKAMMPHRTSTPEQKLVIFKTKFIPKFPPVLDEWFLSTFPDPTAWYLARLAYSRTTAVMSMVGYIVGLGDRHGENILFDSSCGDTVHVDLNCLFNKGETMECPECVPFRLTHNMVHAMGPTGYEGVFRRACEVTMRVIRSRTDALMSVLRPFVHDPLVEWSKSRNSRALPSASGEIRNEMGLTHVKDIELRLNGIIRSKNKAQGLPLSVEGQVNYLIQEATDEKNLSQMYIGWTAYI